MENLLDQYSTIVEAGGRFYLFGILVKALGMIDAELPIELAMPTVRLN